MTMTILMYFSNFLANFLNENLLSRLTKLTVCELCDATYLSLRKGLGYFHVSSSHKSINLCFFLKKK